MAEEQHSHESFECRWSSAEELLMPIAQTPTDAHLAPELLSLLENEMVPRLMLLQQRSGRDRAALPDEPFAQEDVEELARLLLSHDATVAGAYVELLHRAGASIQHLCLNLMAPAARFLGRLWEEDRLGFADVTMAVCRLHQVLHRLTADELLPSHEGQGSKSNTVLLSCLPGEQHSFGVLMVAQFLRRGGWDVWNDFPADNDELVDIVGKKPFKIIGLSIGRDSRLRELTALIKALRRASMNRKVAVLIGGPVVALRPEIGREVGADATAVDALAAARWAQRYWQSVTEQA
jgi:MerR family transcriptional regulator, light-induced transcriptional regulator